MNRALWLLLGLQVRGWLRYLKQSMRTVRGALLVMVGLAVFVPWMLAVLLNPVGGGLEPAMLERYGPASLLLYCVVNVLFSSQERAIYFTPAEVQFLFTGPFSRREVLAYKILLTLLVSVPATLLMGAIVRIRHGWPPAMLGGLFLISVFMQLFSMVLGLLTNAVEAQLFSRGRKLIGLVVLAVILGALAQAIHSTGGGTPAALADRIFETQVWRIASWPLRSFFELMTVEHARELAWPFLRGLAVDVGLLLVVFAMDRYYQEASAAASARLYARQQRMRGRSAGAESVSGSKSVHREVPSLPWWGGVGPILWRQLTTALRGMARLILVLFVIGITLSVTMLGSMMDQQEAIAPTAAGLGVWLSVFLTALVPFDFRGDIDRIGVLKTLPIEPLRLVVGQLLTPVLLLSAMQWLALLAALAIAPGYPWVILALAVYVLPFNFVLVALENLLFLLFPVRVMAATPGDFQALGRNVLLSLGKVIGLAVVGGIATLVGLGTAVATGSIWWGVVAAWPVVAASGAALVPLVALAFLWFDVGRDTPA